MNNLTLFATKDIYNDFVI